jgi:hypothetical protein
VTAADAATVATATRRANRIDDLLGKPVSMRAMALLRILVAPIVLLHLRPMLEDAWHGRTYRDRFHEPYASWYPELAPNLYIAVLWMAALAAVAMAIGLRARAATITVAVVVTYDLFLSTTNFHNNRAYLVLVLAALAVTPCDRELSLDAWVARRRGDPPRPTTSPGWPLWLLRFEAATVYGASGLSKLLDPDWFSGEVTWHRLVRTRHLLEASALPPWSVDLLTDRTFNTVAAKFVIATELFIALGLWSRRTRYAAVWVAVCFHVAIQLSASVEVFSYLAVAALVIWSVPSTRDRTLHVDPARHGMFVAVVQSLDWLARFRIESAAGPITLVDRDGQPSTGGRAVAMTLSRLPVVASFALPVVAAGHLTRRRRPAP